jgi:hypothetical protein
MNFIIVDHVESSATEKLTDYFNIFESELYSRCVNELHAGCSSWYDILGIS